MLGLNDHKSGRAGAISARWLTNETVKRPIWYILNSAYFIASGSQWTSARNGRIYANKSSAITICQRKAEMSGFGGSGGECVMV